MAPYVVDSAVSAVDPYDWSIDEVIHAFCSSNGLLIRRHKTYDLDKIARDLRDNDVNGEVLLSELPTGTCLKDDFGIRSIGQLKAFKEEIVQLRSRSQKWQQSPDAVQERTETKSQQKFNQIASFFHRLTSTPASGIGQPIEQHDSSPAVPAATDFGSLFSTSPNRVLRPSRTSGSLTPLPVQAPPATHQLPNQPRDDETRSGNRDGSGEPKQKKRRVAPQLVQPSQESRVPRETIHHSKEATVAANSRSDNGMPGYLGLQSMPVDRVFYGKTAVGQAVEHKEVSLHPLEERALKRAGGFDGASDPERVDMEHDTQLVFDLDVPSVPKRNGRALYLNNRMKHFLLASKSLGPDRYVSANRKVARSSHQLGRDYIFGIKPYHEGILKYSKDPGSASLTIFKDRKAKRERLRDWAELDSETAEIEEIYDRLEAKWVDENDTELPLYGESDSEGKVYSDGDDSEDEVPDTPKASRQRLTRSQATAIVKEEISLFMDLWRTNKLPHLERQAYSIWKKGRSSRLEDIRMCEGHLERLDDRLDRLTSDLAENQYDKADDLRKQCTSLHITLGDKAATEWKVSLLRQKTPPPRFNSNKQLNQVKSARKRPVDLASDEEELTDEENYRFIDDSSDLADEDQFQAPTSPEEFPRNLALPGTHDTFMEEDSAVGVIAHDTPAVISPDGLQAMDEGSVSQAQSEPGDDGNPFLDATPQVEDDLDFEELSQDVEMHDQDENNDSPDSLIGGPHREGSINTQETLLPPVRGASQPPNKANSRLLSDQSEDGRPPTPQAEVESNLVDSLMEPGRADDEVESDAIEQAEDEDENAGSQRANGDDKSTASEFEAPGEDEFIPFSSNVKILSSDIEPDDKATSEPSKNGLPSPSDITRLRRLSPPWINFVCDKKLRSHLLGLLIGRRLKKGWPLVIEVMKGKQSSEMIHSVWGALEKFLGHHTKIRGSPDDVSGGLLQLATWFVAWFCYFVPDDRGLSIANIHKTLRDGEQDFHEFWDRLEELNLCYDRFKKKPSIVTHKPSAAMVRKKDEAGSKRLSSSKSGRKSVVKSKKRPLTESQKTSEWHDVAAQRKRLADERVKYLHKDWRNGGNGEAKVYINGSSDKEPIEINKHISCRIKKHQIDGINFLWREAIEAGEGSLLAHVMGLGKTMQCITFLVTIAEASRSENENIRAQIPLRLRKSQTLILCPPGLVQNWYDELLKWAPVPREENIGHIRLIDRDVVSTESRLLEIQEWVDKGGVLVIPYSIMTPLVNNRLGQKIPLEDKDHEFVRAALLERPNIVIADEAQTFKNPDAQISKVIKQIKTKTRIALTGSPLANNLAEYYYLLDWTSEGYLGTYSEFKDQFETPIATGLYLDASRTQKREALKTLKVLEEELSPKVLRADYTSMHGQMRGKTEVMFKVSPTDIQKQCYDLFVEAIRRGATKAARQGNILAWLDLLKLLCNHPKCFADRLKEKSQPEKKLEASDKSDDDDAPPAFSQGEAFDKEAEEIAQRPITHMGLTDSMVKDQLALFGQLSSKLCSPQLSHKMRLLARILELSREAREKVLICSQSITTLDYVEKFILKKYKSMRIDGSIDTTKRQELVRHFNESDAEEVMLISTRAGGVGINLYGASRVVIIDESWNPMNEQQAIGRAYRIGQKKHVYVYRFIVAGSFEEKLLNQATFKLQLATRVVDQKDTVRRATRQMGEYIEPFKEVPQEDLTEFEGKDVLVLDEILREQNEERIILSMQENDSFLEAKETLSPEEEDFVREMQTFRKLRRTNPTAFRKKCEDLQRGHIQATLPASVVASLLEQPLRVSNNSSSGASWSGDIRTPTTFSAVNNNVPNNQIGVASTAQPARTQASVYGSPTTHGLPITANSFSSYLQPGFNPSIQTSMRNGTQVPLHPTSWIPQNAIAIQQQQSMHLSPAPSNVVLSSASTRPSELNVSDVKRQEVRCKFEISFKDKVTYDKVATPAQFARKAEDVIFKLSHSVKEYDQRTLEMLDGVCNDRWRESILKSKGELGLDNPRSVVSISDNDQSEVATADAGKRIENPDQSERPASASSTATISTINRPVNNEILREPQADDGDIANNTVSTQAEKVVEAAAQLPAVDSNDENSGYASGPSAKERRSRKANVRPFNLEPIEVEREPHHKPMDGDATGIEATGEDLPTNTDGSDDNHPDARVKAEPPARPQSKLRNARTPQTSFRQPPGQHVKYQGDSERMIPVVSLVSSDDDHNGATDSDEMYARPYPTPRLPLANSTKAGKASQTTPRKRHWNTSSDENGSGVPRAVARNRRGRSGSGYRGNKQNPGEGGTPRGLLAPVEVGRHQGQASGSNVRQPFHGLPSSSSQPNNRFGHFSALDDALRSGADWSFSRAGNRG